MKINMRVTDLTLRGQLSKINYGDDLSWTKLSDKELKQDFLKVLNYYQENEKYLSKKEKEYLKQLQKVNEIVYKK